MRNRLVILLALAASAVLPATAGAAGAVPEGAEWTEATIPSTDGVKLRRGAHRSVRALNADIRTWIETWNENPRPFVWTKTADEILESIGRYCTRINESRH